ncbi:MAG: hypothetical protein M1831_001998 [Alyxoria varia]|nr:MAG: hypothetical protein M1831_001998 [Alyxoria varia]
MREMAESSLKVVRVWGYNTVVGEDPGTTRIWFQRLTAPTPENPDGAFITNELGDTGLKRLDFVLDTAVKYKLKVIVVLLNNFLEPNLGGLPDYVQAFGGDVSTWWTDALSQAAYTDYVKTVVTRYKDREEIFAWELMNEPRCNLPSGGGCDKSVITDWATKISGYIKGPESEGLGDTNHMVSLGDEGWFHPDNLPEGADGGYPYQNVNGVDFIATLQIPTLDFGTFHTYPERFGEPDEWAATYINQHVAAGAAANKPVINEEYGKEKDPEPTNRAVPDSGQRVRIVTAWQDAIFNSQVAAGMYWQLGSPWSADKTEGDPVTVFDDVPAEYKPIFTDHARRMIGLPVEETPTGP